MTSNRWEIPAENLRARVDPQPFPLATTEELPNLDGIIGQECAVRAMEFGLQVQGQGYNIYVSGAPGTGKNTQSNPSRPCISRATRKLPPSIGNSMRPPVSSFSTCTPYRGRGESIGLIWWRNGCENSSQGVIVPRPNLQHLMLNEDVVEAVAAGRFHVYAVSTVDEAVEILMDRPAGERQPDGSYPASSVNAVVLHRLHEMHDRLHALQTASQSRQAERRRRTSLP